MLVFWGLSLMTYVVTQQQEQEQCTKFTIRKEINDLTETELITFKETIRQAFYTPDKENPSVSIWKASSDLHTRYQTEIHGTAAFWFWHRLFLYSVEKKLQQINANFSWPYWNTNAEYLNGDWQNSPALKTTDLSDTPFSCFRNLSSYDLVHPDQWTLISQESMLNKQGFQYWAPKSELLHGTLHVWVGGREGHIGEIATMEAPKDPLFYIHHSGMDLIWATAQVEWAKEGYPQVGGFLLDKSPAGFESLIPGHNNKFADVLDITRLCVVYQPPIKSMIPQIPPNPNPQPNPPSNPPPSNPNPPHFLRKRDLNSTSPENANSTSTQVETTATTTAAISTTTTTQATQTFKVPSNIKGTPEYTCNQLPSKWVEMNQIPVETAENSFKDCIKVQIDLKNGVIYPPRVFYNIQEYRKISKSIIPKDYRFSLNPINTTSTNQSGVSSETQVMQKMDYIQESSGFVRFPTFKQIFWCHLPILILWFE